MPTGTCEWTLRKLGTAASHDFVMDDFALTSDAADTERDLK